MTIGPSISVLIVDDHTMFAEGLSRSLSASSDIEVVGCAATGREAEERCREAAPDVVLMDFGLPDQDGARTTRAVRAEAPDIKVVMLTSLVDDSVVLSAIDAGCSGYVTKDKSVSELVDAIRAAHAGEALIAPAMLVRLLPRLRRSYQGLGSDLTAREREVLSLLAEGLPNKDIAERLVVSLNTVRTHVQNVLSKLQAHSKLEAVAVAAREAIIDLR
ncbi:MAG: response regulator [Actinomycetota bacterium]